MKKLLLLIILIRVNISPAQDLAQITVKAREGAGITPVMVPLDGLSYSPDTGRIALFESTVRGEKEIVCQPEFGSHAALWFFFDHREGDKKFVIRQIAGTSDQTAGRSLVKTEQGTTLRNGNTPVLTYNHAEVIPPEGVNMLYRRAAFIHPLWSPGGEILTAIQPPDHYHHYGIWNPWTKTTIDGREVDFWNLVKDQGTVRFGGYLDAVEGAVFAGLKVLQEHIFFGEKHREKVAINEVWDVRMWKSGLQGVTIIDLTSTLNTPLPGGILLNNYRYGGGVGFRATGKWHNNNCSVLTSLGKIRTDADGTCARWCIVEGESSVPEGRSGILFLSHPANRMHPEPMRVWPSNANNGRGDLFFEFCPIRHNEWQLTPGRNYALKYRLVVFDGKISAREADKYWNAFAQAPLIRFDVN